MTICHYTNTVSAHQLPLDRELVKLVGAENFRYVYDNSCIQGGAQEVSASDPWIVRESKTTKQWLENCDLLIVGGIRPIDLMERRLAAGKATFYMSERWFKPSLKYLRIPFFDFNFELRLPGALRLLHPGYFKMARRFVRLFESPRYRFLPIGPHSARDMRLLCRIINFFTFHFSFFTPEFIPWGDFVAPSSLATPTPKTYNSARALRVLWVGRMLNWKRVDTLIRAVAQVNEVKVRGAIERSEIAEGLREQWTDYTLTVVGDGPEKGYLQKFANSIVHLQPSPSPIISFLPPVSLERVRQLMRAHDIYVLPSNAYEGWGAVVLEAMTEGMTVLGTYEAGASAALLPKENLFHCGDWRTLAKMLKERNYKPTPLPYDYTPEGAAKRLLREFDIMRGSCSLKL